MRDRFVEFFSRGYFKGRDGPAFEDTELANYSTESIFINYSGIMYGFSFVAASFESTYNGEIFINFLL